MVVLYTFLGFGNDYMGAQTHTQAHTTQTNKYICDTHGLKVKRPYYDTTKILFTNEIPSSVLILGNLGKFTLRKRF